MFLTLHSLMGSTCCEALVQNTNWHCRVAHPLASVATPLKDRSCNAVLDASGANASAWETALCCTLRI